MLSRFLLWGQSSWAWLARSRTRNNSISCSQYFTNFGWSPFYTPYRSTISQKHTSKVYFCPELMISIITSILNFTGLILSECILASFIIIRSGLVLNYSLEITYGFCVPPRHRHNNKRRSRCMIALCRPCLGLTRNGSPLCCIRCNWSFVICSFFSLVWIFFIIWVILLAGERLYSDQRIIYLKDLLFMPKWSSNIYHFNPDDLL